MDFLTDRKKTLFFDEINSLKKFQISQKIEVNNSPQIAKKHQKSSKKSDFFSSARYDALLNVFVR